MVKLSTLNEMNYIVGIELSTHEAIVSYLDHKSLTPIIFDLSGGYGQVAIPLVMLYLTEENDWLIGENAYLNKNQEGTVIVDKLLDLLLRDDLIMVDKKEFTPEALLYIFINKILNGFLNLNPKAKIVDLAVALPDYIYDEVQEKVQVSLTPLTNQIKFQVLPNIQCLIKYLDFNEVEFNGKSLVLHYEYEQLRSSIIDKNDTDISIMFDRSDEYLSIKSIEKVIEEDFIKVFLEHIKAEQLAEEDEKNITQLIRNQLPWFFQKYGQKQGMRLYFNFSYPPFQKIFSYKQMEALLSPFEEKLKTFISHYDLYEQVILLGAGYKMQWPTTIINEWKNQINISPFDSISKGCCLIAAKEIIGLTQWSVKYKPTRHRHLGIIIQDKSEEKFMPIKEGSNLIIINIEGEKESRLPIYYREPSKKTMTVEQEVLIDNKSNDNIVRINLQMAYVEESIHIAIEYLPL